MEINTQTVIEHTFRSNENVFECLDHKMCNSEKKTNDNN